MLQVLKVFKELQDRQEVPVLRALQGLQEPILQFLDQRDQPVLQVLQEPLEPQETLDLPVLRAYKA